MNIVLIGMPGCGKTFIGKIASEKSGMAFYDMDSEIEKSEGRSISEMFKTDGEEYFRNKETEMIEKLSKMDNIIISTGGGVIKNKRNIEIAKSGGGVIVFINRSVEDIANDVETAHRPLLANGTQELYKLYNERIWLYNEYSDVEVKNDTDANEVADRILKIVN